MEIPESIARYVVSGLTPDSLDRLEQSLGFRLPDDHQKLLLVSDGLSIGGGLLIYGSEILVERNKTWEVAEYMPGFVAIGDSGAGEVFLMRLDSSDRSVYVVDSGVMDVEFMSKVGVSIEEWLKNG